MRSYTIKNICGVGRRYLQDDPVFWRLRRIVLAVQEDSYNLSRNDKRFVREHVFMPSEYEIYVCHPIDDESLANIGSWDWNNDMWIKDSYGFMADHLIEIDRMFKNFEEDTLKRTSFYTTGLVSFSYVE